MSDIYFNGVYVGRYNKPKELVSNLIKKRRNNVLPKNLNVVYYEDKDEVQIHQDEGRVRRPLIIVENGKSKVTPAHIKQLEKGSISWDDLIKDNFVEYLDAEEEENTYVAIDQKELTKKHTHLEIDPLLIFGVGASLLVYAEKNRGDRLNYGSRMIVQATGIYSQNYLLRDDTTSQILAYPQIPLVKSDTTKAVKLDTHPAGQNLLIAIMPFYGYNMEDALIINKSSIDRGLGRSISFRTYVTEARRYWGGQEDEIDIPESNIRGYKSEEEYSKLEEEGIISVETPVKLGNVLVGKTSPLRFLGVVKEIRMGIKTKRDNSLTVDKSRKGLVEKVILTESEDGNKLVKVVVREPKIPEIGDKFATRHGQKGVIGLIVPEEDMPFTEDGTTPDIIINPHAIPSRMTVGQLLEIIAGKTGALAGRRINGTNFKGSEENIRKALNDLGFRDDGKEVMYNGITGERIESQILIGVGYFQRLYHMVSNKIHARSRGPVALLTKQPTEGRSKEGGLRFGEMEKDCLIGYGAATVLKERFSSDITNIPVCLNCGGIAVHDKIKGKLSCPLCKKKKVEHVNLSHAFKLLLDELRSMMIHPEIKVGAED